MPVKVAHLIHTLGSGGAERQLANMVCSTSSEKVIHKVCVFNRAEFLAPQIRAAGYEVIVQDLSGNRPLIRGAIGFRKVLKEFQPDIIHSWLYDANISARLARLAYKKVPIITSLQLADYEPEAARIGNWPPHKVRILKSIDKFTAWATDPFFVPCSEFVSKSYQKYFGMRPDRAEVIPNSFEPELLKNSGRDVSELRTEIGLPDDAFVFLNVGRLDPQKNHTAMIAAFCEIAVNEPDIYLVFVGIGALEAKLKTIAELSGVLDRIFFLGRRSDIGDLLALTDVFVFPSLFEGLGVALVEAMSKGLACIASDIPVFREFVTNETNGILVDPNSQTDLAHAMLRLINDNSLRKRLGESAAHTADATFSVGVNTPKWEDLYERIAAKQSER